MIGTPVKPTVARYADTIADLKTLRGAPGQVMTVAGYYLPGDGGGGTFRWNAGDTTGPDDGLIVQATGYAVGRWRRMYAGPADAAWWGAIGDDVTDRTVRMQTAVDSAVPHICIRDNGHAIRWSMVLLGSNIFLDVDLNARITSTQLPAPNLNFSKPLLRNKTYFGTQVFTVAVVTPIIATWGLTINGVRSPEIPNGVSAATLKTTIEALTFPSPSGPVPVVPAGGVTSVTGPNGGPWVITFDVTKTGAVSLLVRGYTSTVTVTRGGTGDSNIRVRGGIWDAGAAREASFDVPGSSASFNGGAGIGGIFSFAAVDGLTVEDYKVGNTGMTIFYCASSTRIVVRNVHIYKGDLDGIHISGPWWNLLIDGVTGSTGDDGVIVMPQDWLINSPYKGHGRDTIIQNCRMGSCFAHFVRMSVSGGANLYNMTIRNCTVDAVGIAAVGHHLDFDQFDSATNPYTQGLGQNILIDDVKVNSWGNVLFLIEQPFNNFTIRNCPLHGGTADGIHCVYVAVSVAITDGGDNWGGRGLLIENCRTGGEIDVGPLLSNHGNVRDATIANVTYSTPVSANVPGPMVDNVEGLIDRLAIINAVVDLPRNSFLTNHGTAKIRDLTIDGLRLTQTTANAPSFVYDSAVATGGVPSVGIDRIWLNRVHASGGVHFYRKETLNPSEVWLRDSYVDGYANVNFIPVAATSVLHWSHNVFNNCNYLVARTTVQGGNTTVHADNNRVTGTLSGVYIYNVGSGVDTFRYRGIDLAQDLTLLTPTKWDTALSIVAATGPAMYDGAAWQKWGHA